MNHFTNKFYFIKYKANSIENRRMCEKKESLVPVGVRKTIKPLLETKTVKLTQKQQQGYNQRVRPKKKRKIKSFVQMKGKML